MPWWLIAAGSARGRRSCRSGSRWEHLDLGVATQLPAESTMLTIAGPVVGLWSGRMAAGLMWGLRPEGVIGADLVTLDGRVLAFSLVAAVLAGCVFGR